MSRRTDDSENMEIRGMITILPDSFNGDGSLEVSGKVFTDSIQSNTENVGVLIEEILVKESMVVIKNDTITPSLPVVDSHTFYVKDQLFQSLDSNGITTVYQPTTSKGDLLSHDGTTQIRLPIGAQGTVLTSDPTTSSGLSWKPAKASNISRINLLNQDDVIVADASFGNTMNIVSPCVPQAAGACFIFSKSLESVGANIMTIVQAPSSFGARIIPKYSSFCSPEIRKNDSARGDGDYTSVESSTYSKTSVALPANASWVQLSPQTKGNLFLSVFSEDGEESCSFLISKSIPLANGAAISKLASSPGFPMIDIQVRWTSNGPLQIRKAYPSANDSQVFITSNLETNFIEESVALSGITSVSLKKFRIYEKKNVVVSMTSEVPDSPMCITFLAKELRNTGTAKYSVSSPGGNGTNLIVNWNVNSGISVRKTTSSYDGIYNIQIVK